MWLCDGIMPQTGKPQVVGSSLTGSEKLSQEDRIIRGLATHFTSPRRLNSVPSDR